MWRRGAARRSSPSLCRWTGAGPAWTGPGPAASPRRRTSSSSSSTRSYKRSADELILKTTKNRVLPENRTALCQVHISDSPYFVRRFGTARAASAVVGRIPTKSQSGTINGSTDRPPGDEWCTGQTQTGISRIQ